MLNTYSEIVKEIHDLGVSSPSFANNALKLLHSLVFGMPIGLYFQETLLGAGVLNTVDTGLAYLSGGQCQLLTPKVYSAELGRVIECKELADHLNIDESKCYLVFIATDKLHTIRLTENSRRPALPLWHASMQDLHP